MESVSLNYDKGELEETTIGARSPDLQSGEDGITTYLSIPSPFICVYGPLY